MAAWSAAAASLAFVVLTVFAIVAMRSASRKVERLEERSMRIEQEAVALLVDLRKLSERAAETTVKLNKQLSRTDRLFEAAEQLEDAVRQTADAAQRVSGTIHRTAVQHVERTAIAHKERIGEALDWAELGWTAWQWWQAKRAAAAAADSPVPEERKDGVRSTT